MHQIEGQRKNSRSRSNGSKASMYRSPSVFMAQAEIAAGSFANKYNKTQNSPRPSPRQQATTGNEEDDTVVIQQLSDLPKKRVTTANQNVQRPQRPERNFAKSAKKNNGHLMMSQTQQNLNKLRMSRQSIQNLHLLSQRTTDMSYFGVAGRHMSQGQKTATAVGSGFTLS